MNNQLENNDNKNIMYTDRVNNQDYHVRTRIIARNPVTQEVIWEEQNKVVISGSAFSAAKHFNITPPVKTPTYNSTLGLENTVSEPFGSAGIRREECVVLFCMGTDGCGPDQHQKLDVDYKRWIKPDSLVPFRYPNATSDLTAQQRGVYFGRKVVSSKVAYYFKKFDQDPVFVQRYLDGTPISTDVHTNPKETAAESYIELKLKITKEDAREYFEATTGINDARVNTISLCTAWPKTYTDKVYYQDIRPFTKLNFPTELLIDQSKGIDITYQIFY